MCNIYQGVQMLTFFKFTSFESIFVFAELFGIAFLFYKLFTNQILCILAIREPIFD